MPVHKKTAAMKAEEAAKLEQQAQAVPLQRQMPVHKKTAAKQAVEAAN